MATKKKGKKATKSKPTSAKKVPSTRRVAKKHVPKKPTAKKKGRAASSKKTVVTDMPLRRKVTRRSSIRESTVFEPATGRSRSGGQSGDLQGLRDVESADSESVDELLEEGNAFEADVVAGVEHVEDNEEREVHTHEVPEDDVPEEYLDKD
jgi:hypothetical protein